MVSALSAISRGSIEQHVDVDVDIIRMCTYMIAWKLRTETNHKSLRQADIIGQWCISKFVLVLLIVPVPESMTIQSHSSRYNMRESSRLCTYL